MTQQNTNENVIGINYVKETFLYWNEYLTLIQKDTQKTIKKISILLKCTSKQIIVCSGYLKLRNFIL